MRVAEEELIPEMRLDGSNPADASGTGAAQINPVPLPVLIIAALEGGVQSKCCISLIFVN